MQCNTVDVFKGPNCPRRFKGRPCQLWYGHDGEHQWNNPQAEDPSNLFDGRVRQTDGTYSNPKPLPASNI